MTELEQLLQAASTASEKQRSARKTALEAQNAADKAQAEAEKAWDKLYEFFAFIVKEDSSFANSRLGIAVADFAAKGKP